MTRFSGTRPRGAHTWLGSFSRGPDAHGHHRAQRVGGDAFGIGVGIGTGGSREQDLRAGLARSRGASSDGRCVFSPRGNGGGGGGGGGVVG